MDDQTNHPPFVGQSEAPVEVGSSSEEIALPQADTTIQAPDVERFPIYISFAYASKNGKRSGFDHRVLQFPVPEITTEAHLGSVIAFLREDTGYPTITPISWVSLD